MIVDHHSPDSGVQVRGRAARTQLEHVGVSIAKEAEDIGSIFAAVADGTLERARRPFDVPFGFGGLTLPERGVPIPCRLLMGEMGRLGCRYSFLRRSFHRDVQGRELAVEIPRLLESLRALASRSPLEVEAERLALRRAIADLEASGAPALQAVR